MGENAELNERVLVLEKELNQEKKNNISIQKAFLKQRIIADTLMLEKIDGIEKDQK